MLPKRTNIQPSFLIKNINYNDIHKKHERGYFNRPIPEKALLKVSKLNAKVNTNVAYENFKTVHLSGSEYAKIYSNNKHLKHGGICDYCKRTFTSEIKGYPVSYEQHQMIEDGVYRLYHFFWIDGCFDTDECCLAYCETVFNNFSKYNMELDSTILLKYMYNLMYQRTLIAAKAARLLDINGGSMTYEEWSNAQVDYVRVHNVIKIPAQIPYIKK
jgi:hypothetical protein